MKLRTHLILLVVAALLPVLIYAGFMILAFSGQERKAVERGLVETARALSLAVDRELADTVHSLQALATSEDLRSGKLKKFYEQASRALKTQEGWDTILLIDRSGKRLFNLRVPFGARLAPGPSPANPETLKAIELGQPTISNLFYGPIAKAPLVAVSVPVILAGKVRYAVVASLSPAFLTKLLQEQKISPDWLATIIDRNRIIIARTRDSEKFLGKPASPTFAAKSKEAREVTWRGVTLDGVDVDSAASRSDVSGWTVGLAVPVAVIEGPLRRSLAYTAIGGFLLLLVGIVLAVLFGRRIARPIGALAASAAALGRGETLRIEASPIVEANEVARTLEDAAVKRRHAEKQIAQNLARIGALREIDAAITSTLDLDRILDVLLEKIELFLPIAAVTTVRLLNRETGRFEFLACRGADKEEWNSNRTGRRSRAIVAARAPLAVSDVGSDPLTDNGDFFRKRGLVSYLGAPMITKEEVLGVLGLYTKQEHLFTKEEVEFFTTLANQAAIAIHNAQLYDEVKGQAAALEKANKNLQRREEVQRLLKELSQDIVFLDTDSLLNKLTASVREVFEVDVCDVRILLDENHWWLGGVSGLDPQRIASSRSGSAYGRIRWIIENRRPLIIPDSAQEKSFPPGDTVKTLGLRGYVGVPLGSRSGEVLGVLRALTFQPRDFIQEEVDLLQQLANGAAVAIENARLYEQTKNQALELERSNRVKDEFLSIMSHEMRTPLSVVTGYVGMLKDRMLGEINAKQEEALQKVLLRAGEQLNMINDVMQTTQLESRLVTVGREPVSLQELFDQLQADYELRGSKRGVRLVWDYRADAAPLVTDRAKLKQILQNLINNALKFTDKGSVTITAVVRDSSFVARSSSDEMRDARSAMGDTNDEIRATRYVEFTVTDTGPGIPADQAGRIFEKFYQVDSSETRVYEGVGLGLYIVKKFTELLGGQIEVASEVGKGTTFTVTLPV